ncbi:MAG TPA: hypothetical protein VF310_13975 [Vicinamibacteria bacterium]
MSSWPTWRAEEHDFEELGLPPSPPPVTWSAEEDPFAADEDADLENVVD